MMPTLTISHGGGSAVARFAGAPTLATALRDSGYRVDTPCGGKGLCGKCRVRASGALSPMTDRERAAGCRLACQTTLMGDATVELLGAPDMRNIAVAGERPAFALCPMPGRYGLAVDIGTTTLAASLLRLDSGATLATAAMENPQRDIAADVVGRMEAAMDGRGELLRARVTDAVDALRGEVCERAGIPPYSVDAIAATGNTTMLYLLAGKDPKPLSRAPFHADCLFGGWYDAAIGERRERVYLPRCFGAFVGADIACALLASRMCERDESALLVDIGTNGEMALWHGGRLYLCATAAGPAFEGGGISSGVGCVAGAIDRVWQQNGAPGYSTIGDAPPSGICGSGVIDAVATLRALDMLDETGRLRDESAPLGGGVALTQRDIRQIQLAKSAIAAGMLTLLHTVNVALSDVRALYLAGGFGRHIDLRSASAIGLIPRELASRTTVMGNTALAGAEMLMLQTGFARDIDRYASLGEIVALGGNPVFAERYMDCMTIAPLGAASE